MSDIPQSLYIQAAGFLYRDDWTWDEAMRLYRPLNEIESLLDRAKSDSQRLDQIHRYAALDLKYQSGLIPKR